MNSSSKSVSESFLNLRDRFESKLCSWFGSRIFRITLSTTTGMIKFLLLVTSFLRVRDHVPDPEVVAAGPQVIHVPDPETVAMRRFGTLLGLPAVALGF